MSHPFLITAIIQPTKDAPWIKIAYISNNNDVSYHMESVLDREFYSVVSVKSRPADEVEMNELMFDKQGNMSIINNAPVVEGGDNDHVIPNSDPTTGS